MNMKYADLHLSPRLEDSERIAAIIRRASQLTYGLIAISLPQNVSRKEVRGLRAVCEANKMDFVSRVDLSPRTPRELTVSLRRLRRRFEVIAVMCKSKQIARQAGKDRRVDLLNFPFYDPRKRFFDKAEAELASNALASLEIDINLLIVLRGTARVRLLSKLRREVEIAERLHVPIIISSGVSDELLMRRPREMAALASLFDLNRDAAVAAVSKNPETIVRRNREKLKPAFVAPGIKLIRSGRDC